MNNYVLYLLRKFRKQFSLYILAVVFAVLMFVVIAPKALNESHGRTVLNNLSLLYIAIPFIFSCVFIGLVSSKLFRKDIKNTDEQIIFSKPLSRLKILFGKYCVLYMLLSLLTIWIFCAMLATSFIDLNANMNTRLMFALSIAGGTFIVGGLSSGIITLFSLMMNKGIVVLSAIIPSMFVLASFAMIDGTNGSLNREYLGDEAKANSYNEYDSDTNSLNTGIIYTNAVKEYNVDDYYKYVAPIDVYQHLSSLFTLGLKEDSPIYQTSHFKDSKLSIEQIEADNLHSQDEDVINISGDLYRFKVFTTNTDYRWDKDDELKAISEELAISAGLSSNVKVVKLFDLFTKANLVGNPQSVDQALYSLKTYMNQLPYEIKDSNGNLTVRGELYNILGATNNAQLETAIKMLFFRVAHYSPTFFELNAASSTSQDIIISSNDVVGNSLENGYFLAKEGSIYETATVETHTSQLISSLIYLEMLIMTIGIAIPVYLRKSFH